MTGNGISDVRLLGCVTGPVTELEGFPQGFRPPEERNARNRSLVQRAGSAKVAAAAETLFRELRLALRYRRKQLEFACDEGGASIRTPDFDVVLTLDQDPEAAGNYRLTTEVSRFRTPEIPEGSSFVELFASRCDRVAINFGQPLSIGEKVDEIEENDDLAQFLDYDAACTWLTLRLPQLIVEVTPQRMICRLPGERNLAALIAQTQQALTRLAGVGAAGDAP